MLKKNISKCILSNCGIMIADYNMLICHLAIPFFTYLNNQDDVETDEKVFIMLYTDIDVLWLQLFCTIYFGIFGNFQHLRSKIIMKKYKCKKIINKWKRREENIFRIFSQIPSSYLTWRKNLTCFEIKINWKNSLHYQNSDCL